MNGTPIGIAGPTDRVPPYRFGARFRVELADTDLGAIVYYGRYSHLIDRAVLAYRRHLGIPVLGPEGHLFVVRALSVQYLGSARFDDEVEALVRVSKLGRTSHALDVRIERIGRGDPELLIESSLTVVGLDEYGGRPSRMPDEMRGPIEAFERGDAPR
ncbi:MAG: acyl-CoA thioesterase [Thermoleophilia bacterium]